MINSRNLTILLFPLLFASWGIPINHNQDHGRHDFLDLRDALIAVEAMERISDPDSFQEFSYSFAEMVKAIRATAGLEVAVGQDSETPIPYKTLFVILSPPILIKDISLNFEKLAITGKRFSSIDIKPVHPPPETSFLELCGRGMPLFPQV